MKRPTKTGLAGPQGRFCSAVLRYTLGALGIVFALGLLGSGRGASQPNTSCTVTVIADGQTRPVVSSAPRVGDLLHEIGLVVGSRDRVSPALRAPLADRATVRVTRIRCHQAAEETAVKAELHVLAAPDLPAGYTRVLEEGREGRVRRVVEVWEKDGQVSQRNVLRERVLSRAIPEVILRGTAGEPNRGGAWHQPRRMVATGYASRACGGSRSGRTASGLPARRGLAAVDTRRISLGARLYIPGYGFAVAADRGRAIQGNRIDLCFATRGEAARFGRRAVEVYVMGQRRE